jgi:hypothetical protein
MSRHLRNRCPVSHIKLLIRHPLSSCTLKTNSWSLAAISAKTSIIFLTSSSACSFFIFPHKFRRVLFVNGTLSTSPKKLDIMLYAFATLSLFCLKLLHQILRVYIYMLVGWPIHLLPTGLCQCMVVVCSVFGNVPAIIQCSKQSNHRWALAMARPVVFLRRFALQNTKNKQKKFRTNIFPLLPMSCILCIDRGLTAQP